MKINFITKANIKLFAVAFVAIMAISLITISMGVSNANAQDFPTEQPPAGGGFDEIQTPPTDEGIDEVQTPPVDNGDTIDDTTPTTETEPEELGYVPNEVLIYYSNQPSVLVNEDETGTVDLSEIESTFISQGLGVVSEDLSAVGVDTTDLEIFGSDYEINGYYVRYDGKIDPLQLSFQLNEIEGINWAQPNFIYQSLSHHTNDDCIVRNCLRGSWWIDEIKLDDALDLFETSTKSARIPKVAVLEPGQSFDPVNPEYIDNLLSINGSNGGRDFRTDTPTDVSRAPYNPNISRGLAEHGSLVASIVAGKPNNTYGTYGVYSETNTLLLLSGNNSARVADAIGYADREGIDVINGSFGYLRSWFGNAFNINENANSCKEAFSFRTDDGIFGNDLAFYRAIERFDGLYVAAAGNSSLEVGIGTAERVPQIFASDITLAGETEPCFEALPNIILVGGIQQNKFRNYRVEDYSNTDYSEDFVLIAAPAHNIATAGHDGDRYINFGGTSAAAPQVAGTAALLRRINPVLRPHHLINIIHLTGDVNEFLDGKVKDKRTLNVLEAVRCATTTRGHVGSSLISVIEACDTNPPPPPPPPPPVEEDNRNLQDLSSYVTQAYPDITFTKTVRINIDDLSRPRVYDIERRVRTGQTRVPVYTYDVPEYTQEPYTYNRSVYNYENRTRTVPAYNYENRTRSVYNYRNESRSVYNYETRRVSVYNYENRTRSVYNYQTVTRRVYNYETRRTCTGRRHYSGYSYCVRWSTERVRVAPFTQTTRVRVAPFTETYRARVAPYFENRRVRVEPFYQTTRIRVAPFTETYRARVAPYTRTENYRVRVAPFTESVTRYRTVTNYVTRSYDYEAHPNLTRIEPRWRNQDNYIWRDMRVRSYEVRWTGEDADRNIRVAEYYQKSVDAVARVGFNGRYQSCVSIWWYCSENMSTINSQRNIVANYNGQTENWHHTYLQIQNARTYDSGFVGSDGAKLSVYEVLPMMRNVDADEQLDSDTIATLISDVRTVNADTDHDDRVDRRDYIQRRYS